MRGTMGPPGVSYRPLQEYLGEFLDPLEALRRVRRRRHPVLLLSGLTAHGAARYSILAWDPVLVVAVRGNEAIFERDDDGQGKSPV